MTAREHMHATQEGKAMSRDRSQAVRLFALVFAVAAALAIVLGAMISGAQAAPGYKYKTYKVPNDNSNPLRYITEGSDGNYWFTEDMTFDEVDGSFVGQVGRITPSGDITEFNACNDCSADDIVQGPGGVLYFSSSDPGLGRITTSGEILPSVVPHDEQGNRITDAAGNIARDGDDVWFGNGRLDSLFSYNATTGQFTQYPGTNNPGDVAVDEGGTVWFTAPGAIGSLDPATGVTTTTTIPDDVSPGGQGSSPHHIAIASDGKVWFTDRFNHGVGYVDPSNNNQVSQFPTLTPDAGPFDIAAADDGSVWFTQGTVGNVARIAADGTITEEGKATGEVGGNENAFGVTIGSDQSVWYTLKDDNQIASLTPPQEKVK